MALAEQSESARTDCSGTFSLPGWAATRSSRETSFRSAALPETSPSTARRSLVLVAKRSQNHLPDFVRMSRYIRTIAPDVRPVVVADRPYNALRPSLWLRPTLVFSPVLLRKVRLIRGRIFHGISLSKSEEYARLETCGIPVPRWALLTEHQHPNLDGFGNYVVSKPDRGGRGAEVKIRKKTRVRWKPIERTLPRRCSDLVVQEFIYTGPWPISYRVTTLFGKALWSWMAEADHARRPLKGADVFADGPEGGGMSIVSTGSGCRFSLSYDAEVIALAERAHAAFPDIPLIGVDIIREQPGGRLYVIEVNSCGQTWHFNSPTGRAIQEQFAFDLESQFDGLRKASHILIDHTRRLAA